MRTLIAVLCAIATMGVSAGAAPADLAAAASPKWEVRMGEKLPTQLTSLIPQQYQDDLFLLQINSARMIRFSAEDPQPEFYNRNAFNIPYTSYQVFLIVTCTGDNDPDVAWIRENLQHPLNLTPIYCDEKIGVSRAVEFTPHSYLVDQGVVVLDNPDRLPDLEATDYLAASPVVESVKVLTPASFESSHRLGHVLSAPCEVEAVLRFDVRPLMHVPGRSYQPGSAKIEIAPMYWTYDQNGALGNSVVEPVIWSPKSADETYTFRMTFPAGAQRPTLRALTSRAGSSSDLQFALEPAMRQSDQPAVK